MLGILERILGWAAGRYADRRHVRVTVHAAYFAISKVPCLFVNVTNLSRNRDVVVTHVWFEVGQELHVLEPSRPLPRRLKPDESWETWIERERLPAESRDDPFKLARVRLTSGAVVASVRNVGVPQEGQVPGGGRPGPEHS